MRPKFKRRKDKTLRMSPDVSWRDGPDWGQLQTEGCGPRDRQQKGLKGIWGTDRQTKRQTNKGTIAWDQQTDEREPRSTGLGGLEQEKDSPACP